MQISGKIKKRSKLYNYLLPIRNPRMFWWELTKFKCAGYEEATMYNTPHLNRIIPNLKHFIRKGYITYYFTNGK